MIRDYEIGTLVIDGFEVVEYLGYEEHEEDNYHRLLSLSKGEYLSSAVFGPRHFDGTEAYDEAKRLWNLNKDNAINSYEVDTNLLKSFIEEFDQYKPNISLGYFHGEDIIIYAEGEATNKIKVDTYKLQNDIHYKDLLTNYIDIKIKQLLKDQW